MKRALILLLVLLPSISQAEITFVAASRAGEAAADNSITVTEPAGTAENDLVVDLCQVAAVDGAWTDPADITEITNKVETIGGPDQHLHVGRKIRGSDAGSGYTFSYSGTAATIACMLVTLRGIDTTTPLDVTYVEADHYIADSEVGGAPNTAARPITTVTDGALVLLLQGMTQTISGDAGPPSGYTEFADFLNGIAVNQGTYAAGKIVATAGTETPGVFTHVDDGVSPDPDNRNFTLAIRAATESVAPQRRRHSKLETDQLMGNLP